MDILQIWARFSCRTAHWGTNGSQTSAGISVTQESSLKLRLLGFPTEFMIQWGLRICISNRFPGDADPATNPRAINLPAAGGDCEPLS